MAAQRKFLDWIFGKPASGELVDLPDRVHVSPKGGLRIASDKDYATSKSAAEALVRRFYGLKVHPVNAPVADPDDR